MTDYSRLMTMYADGFRFRLPLPASASVRVWMDE